MGCSITGGAGRRASWACDVERSDAVDGVRHQFSRARPDLGLRHPQLSRFRGRTVLGRLGVRRSRRCGGGDAALRFGFVAAAAGRRHRADFRRLPCRDGHQAVLWPAGIVAHVRCDRRIELCRHRVLHFRSRQPVDADPGLFAGPVGAAGADAEAAAVAAGRPRKSRRPARGHRRHLHHLSLCLPRRGDHAAFRTRFLDLPVQSRCNGCWC